MNLLFHLKKNWILYTIILGIVFLLIAAVLRVLTPQQSVITQNQTLLTNVNGTKSIFKNITYTGENIKIPSNFSLAQISDTSTNEETIKNQLVLEFSLEEKIPAVDASLDIWNGPQYSMSLDKSINHYSLTRNDYQTDFSLQLEPEAALQTARQFVSKYLSGVSLEAQTDQMQFLNGLEDYSKTTNQNGYAVKIPFTYSVNGFPVFYQNRGDSPFEVTITSDNNIQKLSFYPQFTQLIEISGQEFQPLSLEKAISNINNGNASIVAADQQQFGPLLLENIESGSMKKARIEYRINDQSKLAYPFYRFSGEIINSNGVTISADIITPAIDTVFEK